MGSFMFQKSFHPTSQHNKKKKFIAEERHKAEIKQQEELKRLREYEQQQLLRSSSSLSAKQQSVSFLYQPPPGLPTAEQIKQDEKRRKEKEEEDALKPSYMKNAPSEGAYTKNLHITPRPLGHVYKNVRCVRCRHWGHHSTDRECPLSDMNPNDHFRQLVEDPLSSLSSITNPDLIDPPHPHPLSDLQQPLDLQSLLSQRSAAQKRSDFVLKPGLAISEQNGDYEDVFDMEGDKELERRARILLERQIDFGDDEEGRMLAEMSVEESQTPEGDHHSSASFLS